MPQENKPDGQGKEKTLDTTPDVNANNSGDGTGGDKKPDDGTNGGADEEVKIKKSELEQLKKEHGDYKEAVRIANEKNKGKKDTKTDEPGTKPNSSEFVTKKELYATNEKQAIRIATTITKDDSPEIAAKKKILDEHWEEVKAHYTGRSGKETPEDILEDLFDAVAVFERRGGGKKKDGEDKTVKADLATDRGTGGNSPAAGNQRNKRLLPKSSGPADWYKKP